MRTASPLLVKWLQYFKGLSLVFIGISNGAPFATGVRMLIDDAKINDITRRILGCAIEVHRELGPGLLESSYLQCLQYELAACGLRFVAQKTVPIVYKGVHLDACYRIDLIVENVVVEVKAVDRLMPVHEAQVLTYAQLTECSAGLLINFNVPRLMDGVRRLLNNRARKRPAKEVPKNGEATDPTRSHRGTETHEGESGSTGRPA